MFDEYDLYCLLIERHNFTKAEADVFTDFLETLLVYDRFKRPTATECLKHIFMQMDFNVLKLINKHYRHSHNQSDTSSCDRSATINRSQSAHNGSPLPQECVLTHIVDSDQDLAEEEEEEEDTTTRKPTINHQKHKSLSNSNLLQLVSNSSSTSPSSSFRASPKPPPPSAESAAATSASTSTLSTVFGDNDRFGATNNRRRRHNAGDIIEDNSPQRATPPPPPPPPPSSSNEIDSHGSK